MNVKDFAEYVRNYDHAINQGLSITGEDHYYYARKRVEWVQYQLSKCECFPHLMMDFGCGLGDSIMLFLETGVAQKVVGVDVSKKVIKFAKQRYAQSPLDISRIAFHLITDYNPKNFFDMVYTNGVFHHMEPDHWDEYLHYIYRSLKMGGYFCFWENNSWNLGTKYVMKKIPFDMDARPLSPRESQRMLRQNGFKIVNTTYRFLFPKILGFLRPVERLLMHIPFLGQYMILCRKI